MKKRCEIILEYVNKDEKLLLYNVKNKLLSVFIIKIQNGIK